MVNYMFIFAIFFFSGCTTVNKNLMNSKNRVTFINKTDQDITNVRVLSHTTNRKLSCGFIPVNQYCSYSFHQKIKENNSIVVSWHYNNKDYRSHQYIDIIEEKDYPLTLSVQILKNGNIVITGLTSNVN